MLLELHIQNFLIIESLNLDFHGGMTVITGETGAGKSILLDALQFLSGARADIKFIRANANHAEASACFELKQDNSIYEQLTQWGIELEGKNCILRRVIGQDGRSKAYINQQMISIQQLRLLGDLLLNWVGQNEHQELLKLDMQRASLDLFAKDQSLLAEVHESAKKIHALEARLEKLKANSEQQQQALTFKNYQLEILESLSLQENEWDELHQELKQLSLGKMLITQVGGIIQNLHENEENVIAQVRRVAKETSVIATDFIKLENPAKLCEEALMNLGEAYYELKAFYDALELNPERLNEIEQRLSEIHTISRKLQLAPESLFTFYRELCDELQKTDVKYDLERTERDLEDEKSVYLAVAAKLTATRHKAALELAEHVSTEIKSLGMKEAEFDIRLETVIDSFGAQGQDQVRFMIRANPGQHWSLLKEGASGGELSRIALVIAVLNAKQGSAQTLIFDEVDVGISGAVAKKVGALLYALGDHAQVICITHLPQVAMMGQQHIHVFKTFKDGQTYGSAHTLSYQERVEEIARLMSGENITEHARRMAEEGLLETHQ